MATFETAARAAETALFDNITQTAYPIASILNPAYPYDGTTNSNKFTSRLVGNGKKTGATIGLKVMAGDKVDIAVKAWVPVAVTTEGSSPTTPEDILSSLVNIMATKSAMLGGKATAAELNATTSPLYTGMQSFLSNHDENAPAVKAPRAYLNWILFDEQFNYVPAGSGFLQVRYYDDRRLQNLAQLDIPAMKSGYFFVFLTNETKDKYTFFDNLVVQHYSGPLNEETQYYPFGLVAAGISSKAFGGLENNKKYNGIELEKALNLNVYDAQFRELDPQVGRWWQIDPKTDEMYMWSTYASNFDNPVRFEDRLGDMPDCCGGIWDKIANAADKVMLSASGTLWGMLNTSTMGIVSTDPFNVRPGLTSEEKMYWDNGVTVGQIAPLFVPSSRKAGSNSTVVEMVPAGGKPNVQVKVGTQEITAPPTPMPVYTVYAQSNATTPTSNKQGNQTANTQPATGGGASSRVLSWGSNAKGHLIKHADVLGFGQNTPQQLQKMLPQLRGAANQLYNNINPALTRLGKWGGQVDDVLMHITNNGKMLVTKQNGEFITAINKTSNNWYQLAKPF